MEILDVKVAASVEEIVARRPLVRLHRLGHMVNASPRVLIVAGAPLARAGLVALMTDQPEVIIDSLVKTRFEEVPAL